ncbi:MAG: hypothetical protein J7485_10790 [Sphingobium sp.]|nr:hypothetical protein [Sphingobium sp.]
MGRTPPGSVHYWLPTADGRSWRFDVPAGLAKCVGRYARIPEFAASSHLLNCAESRSEARD